MKARKLADMRLHVRAIVRDGCDVFIGSQSLRRLELDGRREVGVVVKDGASRSKIQAVFESDWSRSGKKGESREGLGKDRRDREREREGQGQSRESVLNQGFFRRVITPNPRPDPAGTPPGTSARLCRFPSA